MSGQVPQEHLKALDDIAMRRKPPVPRTDIVAEAIALYLNHRAA